MQLISDQALMVASTKGLWHLEQCITAASQTKSHLSGTDCSVMGTNGGLALSSSSTLEVFLSG